MVQCCSEFATALANGRIVNLNDPDVRRIHESRAWPTTASEYETMMQYTRRDHAEQNAREGLIYNENLGVDFTSKGDRQVVLHNFFKATFDPQAFSQAFSPLAREAADTAPNRLSQHT